MGAESVAYPVSSHVGLDMALRSAHDVGSWPDEPETVTATTTEIHDGAATLMDALDTAMSGSDGTPKVVTIKPAWVFDVSLTDECTPRAAASRAAGCP